MKRHAKGMFAVILCIVVMLAAMSGCTVLQDYTLPEEQEQGQQTQHTTSAAQNEQDNDEEYDARTALMFGEADVERLTTEYKTVVEYIEAAKPTELSWEYIEESGKTLITMITEGGSLTISAELPSDEVNADTLTYESVVDVWALSDEALSTPCMLTEVIWLQEGMEEVLAYPRGIGLDAPVEEVRGAYLDELGEEQYGALYSDGAQKGQSEPEDGLYCVITYTCENAEGDISYTLTYAIDVGVESIRFSATEL